ncbi:SDR family oxidoreductase [Mucilaginibacter sp. KACC 22063]|uniref:SDR family oxidoreductase n=1 Tax=Mucilaginibacter sp. KACC 22063 TaxID=3025666 RepID=UPI002366310B|nr:SDR family oxidoreductase [Mucilaginibacter sp. KACC 22063]WDF54980.1 SDR family oxidoreductase [Mucilaginibacter sp. KACC 22063]
MDLKLTNKIAIVLAASKGLGKAVATALANEGATVIISSRNAEKLNEAAAEIKEATRSKVTCIPADVSKPKDIENLINTTVQKFGRIDILINNTGGPPFDKFETFDDQAWRKAFDDILLSFARNSRLVLPHMKKTGGGRIINIISGSAKSVLANSVLSTSMRMGVVGMAKLMADELGAYNITVNNVAPGLILTDRVKDTLPKDKPAEQILKERAEAIPLKRIGKPEEFAGIVAFLASEKASYITGTTIQVDGGASRSIY